MAERRLEDYRYPVYATQGGGLARCVNGTWIFVTDPKCPGLGVGDDVPDEWDLAPANQSAREEGRDDLSGVVDKVSEAYDDYLATGKVH